LLPANCSLVEAPWELVTAIGHSNMIISWMENLEPEEMPPRWMLPFPDELDEWFSEVELARQAKYGTGSDDSDYSDMEVNEWGK